MGQRIFLLGPEVVAIKMAPVFNPPLSEAVFHIQINIQKPFIPLQRTKKACFRCLNSSLSWLTYTDRHILCDAWQTDFGTGLGRGHDGPQRSYSPLPGFQQLRSLLVFPPASSCINACLPNLHALRKDIVSLPTQLAASEYTYYCT